MTAFQFSQRSLNNLIGVHPDLCKLALAALNRSLYDFGIISGLRTCELQHQMFVEGKSKLDCPPQAGEPSGRHVTGHAIDFLAYVEGVATETNIAAYEKIGLAFKQAAYDLGIPIQYGGDWQHFKDYDHVELNRAVYPDRSDAEIA